MAKRKRNDQPESGKKKRVESNEPLNGEQVGPVAKIIAGRTDDLTSRENILFDALLGLVSKDKENRICTSSSSSSNLISEAGSVLMMEFDKDKEVLQLWLKSSTGPRVRFFVHPVCTIEAAPAVAKCPLVSFSDNFVESESSRLVKSVLTEIFEGTTSGDDPDYLFAFSRRGNFIHLRTYQILEVPNLFNPKKLKLSRLVQHFCFATNSFTPPGLHEVKPSEAVELSEDYVFIGHHTTGTLHSAVFKGSAVRFILDDLIDLSSWDGFTSSLSDFKERNIPMFWGRLLGDGPDAKASYLNERYKPLIRSLLIETLGLHGKELCFHKISESDVCLSGTTVKFSWKLELLEYDVPIARSNRREIRALIINMFNGSSLPRDLEVLLELLETENLVPGDYLITHCSLMYDVNKGHMINNIYTEFPNLSRRRKLFVAEALCYYINNWKQLIRSNVLLTGISTHKFGLERTPDAGPVAALSSVSLEITPGEDQMNKDGTVADGGNVVTVEMMIRAVSKLVTYLRHCNAHISDQVRIQFKQQIKVQQREIVRIITSKLPILHILQNELRNVFGDKWFLTFFTPE